MPSSRFGVFASLILLLLLFMVFSLALHQIFKFKSQI